MLWVFEFFDIKIYFSLDIGINFVQNFEMLITRSPCQTRAGEAVGDVGDERDVRTVGGVAEGVCPVWELGQPVERSAVAVDCSPDNI